MALIKCTECGKEFSDRAAACPNCGCPTDIILEDIEKEKSIQQKRKQRLHNKTGSKLVVPFCAHRLCLHRVVSFF